MDSNLRLLVARPSTRSWETGLLARKRERICWGTGSSNPSPSSEESGANPALLRALLRHGTDPRITLARSDPISLATLDVLTKLLPPALFSDANLRCLTVCRAVNLSLEHGNSDGSCLCYEKCAALKFGALTRRRETTNPVIGAIAVEGSRCAGRVGERYIGEFLHVYLPLLAPGL